MQCIYLILNMLMKINATVTLRFSVLASLLFTLGGGLSPNASLQAQEPLPYQATFEEAEGFQPGNVHGQQGFAVIRGQAEVTANEGREGSTGLKVLPSRPHGIVQLSIDANLDGGDPPDKVVHTDMYIRPGAALEIGDQVTDVEGSLTGFFKIDDQGELHIYDGPDWNEWLPTGAKFDLDERGNATNWIRLSFRQDFERGLWDIAIDGHIFRANLAMAERVESLEKIELVGQSRSPLYIDDIQVSRDAIAFSDADRDGLPDDWEAGQDLARNGDPDSDGLTNVEEFVLGTDVNGSDTDGDGVSDGDEYEAGTDPLIGSEGAQSAAVLSWTGTNGLDVNISPYGSGYHFIEVSWSSYTEWKIWVYNDWSNPYVYEYMTNQSIGTGSSNWTSSSDYVISTTGQVAFIYIWAADHMNGGVENSVLLKTTSGSDGQVISSYGGGSSIGGGNLGSEEAAEEALDDHCQFCYVSGPTDPDCVEMVLGSVRFSFGLGTSDFGNRRHSVSVHERNLTPHSYSRESLNIDNQGIEVGYDFPSTAGFNRIASEKAKKVISWAKTDTRFVTFSDIEGGYEIRKYTLDQVGEDHIPSGDPYVVVMVYNPDHPLIHANNRRLILEKTEDGRKSIHEYRYFANKSQGRETWELYQGASGSHLTQPLRLKRLITDDPDAAQRGDYTKTWTTHHWNPETGRIELNSKQRETFRRFDFGERKVMRVVDPDNEALTVKLDYYGREAGDFPVVGRVRGLEINNHPISGSGNIVRNHFSNPAIRLIWGANSFIAFFVSRTPVW